MVYNVGKIKKEGINMYFAIIFVVCIVVLSVIVSIFLDLYINKKFKSLRLLYKFEDPRNISIQKDIVYKKYGSKELLMDVYSPAPINPDYKSPVIILLHGEGIEKLLKDIKNWSFYTSYGRLAASKGYTAVTFHRGRTNLNFKNSDVANDIQDAVTFIRNNSDRFNIDINRICIWSFSLGGLYLSHFMREKPTYIRCLISYYGLLDIKFKTKKLNKENGKYQPERYLPEDPADFPPLLIVKAEKDKIKGVNESQENFMKVANERNIPFEVIKHKTGGHTFDGLDDNEETTEVIEKTWSFIRKNI